MACFHHATLFVRVRTCRYKKMHLGVRRNGFKKRCNNMRMKTKMKKTMKATTMGKMSQTTSSTLHSMLRNSKVFYIMSSLPKTWAIITFSFWLPHFPLPPFHSLLIMIFGISLWSAGMLQWQPQDRPSSASLVILEPYKLKGEQDEMISILMCIVMGWDGMGQGTRGDRQASWYVYETGWKVDLSFRADDADLDIEFGGRGLRGRGFPQNVAWARDPSQIQASPFQSSERQLERLSMMTQICLHKSKWISNRASLLSFLNLRACDKNNRALQLKVLHYVYASIQMICVFIKECFIPDTLWLDILYMVPMHWSMRGIEII